MKKVIQFKISNTDVEFVLEHSINPDWQRFMNWLVRNREFGVVSVLMSDGFTMEILD